jgi:ketosteroid isomerase-like protein
MLSANVDVVQRLLDAFNAGDLGALDALDENAELQDEPRMPGAGWYRGHDGAVRWAARLREVFGQLTFAIDDTCETGDAVVTSWRAEGEGKRSGVHVEMAGFCVFTMREARVRRVEFFETRERAVDSARLRGGVQTGT